MMVNRAKISSKLKIILSEQDISCGLDIIRILIDDSENKKRQEEYQGMRGEMLEQGVMRVNQSVSRDYFYSILEALTNNGIIIAKDKDRKQETRHYIVGASYRD